MFRYSPRVELSRHPHWRKTSGYNESVSTTDRAVVPPRADQENDDSRLQAATLDQCHQAWEAMPSSLGGEPTYCVASSAPEVLWQGQLLQHHLLKIFPAQASLPTHHVTFSQASKHLETNLQGWRLWGWWSGGGKRGSDGAGQ